MSRVRVFAADLFAVFGACLVVLVTVFASMEELSGSAECGARRRCVIVLFLLGKRVAGADRNT
jgi:hypothetical protein